MADGRLSSGSNFLRFRVFSGGLPADISTYGYTPEEVKSQTGSPEHDVRIAPMAMPQVTQTQLSLSLAGSDLRRLSSPNEPGFDPHEGPQLMLTLNRSALRKLRSPVIDQVGAIVDEMRARGVPNAEPMNTSVRTRIRAMDRVVTSLVNMASFVRANQAQNLS